MRVAFIPSAYRTIFAHALGGELEAKGHDVFWISPNRRWGKWLVQHGTDASRILDITGYAAEWTDTTSDPDTSAARTTLAPLEQRAGFCIYDLIASDLLMIERGTSYALRYLASCARHVAAFIGKHQIQVVSGELTWAFEQIVGQVCASLEVPFLRPMVVRIPDARTAFFGNRRETDMLELRKPTDVDRAEASNLLHAYRNKPRPPVYMQTNFSVLRANAERIKLLTRHTIDLARDPFDETSRRPFGMIADHSRRVLRSTINRRFGPFEQPTNPAPRPFVLMTLHKQPEFTIDVMATPLTDQVACAKALARSLPITHDLYVKEHLVALGWRTRAFYDALRAIPGVRLIDPRARTFDLIRNARLVVAATGTSTYEASLLGVPAVTFGPTVFSRVLVTDHFNPFADSVTELLERTGGRSPRSDEELIEFLAHILANSIPGIVGDALWEPFVMEPGYAAKVADGFDVAMQKTVPRPRNHA
jgi:hypothetical protein